MRPSSGPTCGSCPWEPSEGGEMRAHSYPDLPTTLCNLLPWQAQPIVPEFANRIGRFPPGRGGQGRNREAWNRARRHCFSSWACLHPLRETSLVLSQGWEGKSDISHDSLPHGTYCRPVCRLGWLTPFWSATRQVHTAQFIQEESAVVVFIFWFLCVLHTGT